MIPPSRQWCIQIDITNRCPRRCSNCTRLISHARTSWDMTPEQFAESCEALKDFPTESEPDHGARRKVVGVMGGEPLWHPQFPQIVDVACSAIPDVRHRGLWTGIVPAKSVNAEAVSKLLGPLPTTTTRPVPDGEGGYLNLNTHVSPCYHQPVLVAVGEVIRDKDAMWKLIEACPLQRDWSSAITPKGFFFCEVAASFDMVFDGPGGLPIEPRCWERPIEDFREQIERWCPRCGVCLPLNRRRDTDRVDDISPGNVRELEALKSPAILEGRYVPFDPIAWRPPLKWHPLRYLKR
jgi:hypothetical protein